jgi:hypothetical protein
VQVFRPWSGIVLTAIVGLIALSILISDWQNLAAWAWSSFLVSATWLGLVRPKLLVADEGVAIVNPISRVQIGWHAIEELDTKYSLTFVTRDKRRFVSWAAPAPGRHHARTVRGAEFKGVGIASENLKDGLIKAGESPRSLSGQAIAICRLRITAFTRAGNLEGLEFRKSYELGNLILVAASLTAALLLSNF